MAGDFHYDLQKYFLLEFGNRRPGFRERLKFYLGNFGFHCVAVYRLARAANRVYRRNHLLGLPLTLLAEPLVFFIRMVYHVDIFAADIGPGLYVGHTGPLYIGPCKVGSNLSVTHNTTIGVNAADPEGGVPSLGDDVWVGNGSVIFGGVKIGSGVTVNAGSVLSKPVPDRGLAGGNPARILQQDYDNSAFFRGFRVPRPDGEKSEAATAAAEPASTERAGAGAD